MLSTGGIYKRFFIPFMISDLWIKEHIDDDDVEVPHRRWFTPINHVRKIYSSIQITNCIAFALFSLKRASKVDGCVYVQHEYVICCFNCAVNCPVQYFILSLSIWLIYLTRGESTQSIGTFIITFILVHTINLRSIF